MDENKINETARAAGFVNAAVISTEQLEFVPEFRKFCKENACGNYGRNYGCPPYCGTPEEMAARVMAYQWAIVFQSRTPVKNIMDDKETKKVKKMHTGMTLKALDVLEAEGLGMDGFPIMCGPCNYCEACKMTADEPCINKKMRFSCLSAYCIDAGKMAEQCGMEMQWNGEIVSFFSLYLFDKKRQNTG